MPIEIESPEQLGYGRIANNLAESSVADATLAEVADDLDLGSLVLQYGDHAGHPELRAAIAADAGGDPAAGRAAPLGAGDVLLAPGAAAALFIVVTSLLGRGDRVLVVRPNYATNLETPRAIGAVIDHLDLRFEDGWRVDPGRIEALLRPDTRLISLTSPHNPTGQVLGPAELADIVGLVERHGGARLLLDETYRDMTYDPRLPSVAALSERAIAVSSLSKTDGLPGIRLGWLATRDGDLQERFLAAKEQMLITGSVVDEAIGAAAFARRPERLTRIRAGIDAALATTRAWIGTGDVFEWVEPRGGVVGFPRVRPGVPVDPDRFYRILFERYGTIVGPGHWFDQPRTHFRLGYGWPTPDRLAAGLAALDAAARDVLA
jgi:aspartate/methionine/tyrosine aminotransferase